MTKLQIIAQVIGIIGMGVNVISFQRKGSKDIIVMQLIGATLFSINYAMLGAVSGCILNVFAIFRALVFSNREKFKSGHPAWLWLFITLFLGTYVMAFTVFGKPLNWQSLLLEALPVIGMIATTIGFSKNRAGLIRNMGLINSPAWLIYNTINFTIGGIICEVLSLCSIVIAKIRLRGQ